MQISELPFGITDWSSIVPTEHPGEQGMAYWRTRRCGSIRVRMVEYTPGYIADHWCVKGRTGILKQALRVLRDSVANIRPCQQ